MSKAKQPDPQQDLENRVRLAIAEWADEQRGMSEGTYCQFVADTCEAIRTGAEMRLEELADDCDED